MTNRHPTVISTNKDQEIDNEKWLSRIQKKLLEKEAVQPSKVDKSLYEQINSIINRKSRYSSVEAAVKDMQERSGLLAFLNKTSNKEELQSKVATEKTASLDDNEAKDKKKGPVLFIKFPNVKKTFENVIKGARGNLSIPAIFNKVKSIHQNDVCEAKDWEDEEVFRYVSNLNLNAKKENPSTYDDYTNLGTNDDLSNSDVEKDNSDIFGNLSSQKF